MFIPYVKAQKASRVAGAPRIKKSDKGYKAVSFERITPDMFRVQIASHAKPATNDDAIKRQYIAADQKLQELIVAGQGGTAEYAQALQTVINLSLLNTRNVDAVEKSDDKMVLRVIRAIRLLEWQKDSAKLAEVYKVMADFFPEDASIWEAYETAVNDKRRNGAKAKKAATLATL